MSLNCEEIDFIIGKVNINSIITGIYFDINENFLLVLKNVNEENRLLVITKDGYSGIFLVPHSEKLQISREKYRFIEYLNSKIKNGRLINITQPYKSRIVKVEIKVIDKIYFLYFRLWGVSSNIILTDDKNNILEVLKRYPKRNEWPGNNFLIPETVSGKNFQIRNFEEYDNKIDGFYFSYINKINSEKIEKIKNQLLKEFEQQKEKIESNIEKCREFIENNRDYEKYKKYGELLLVNKNSLNINEVEVNNKINLNDYDGNLISIEIDKRKSIVDNANYYFEKYKTIKNTINDYEEKILNLKNNYKNILLKIENLKVNDNYEQLKEELDKLKDNKKVLKKSNNVPARKVILSNNYVCYITRSAKDFGALLKYCNGNDYWFHIRDNAGSHVIVKNKKEKSLPDRVKLEASMLALHFSKSKNENEGDIYFTQVKYLHKPDKKVDGLVIPTQEKNIKIRKDVKILDNLLQTIE